MIGFSAQIRSKEEKKSLSEIFNAIEPDDLIKFGLIPEFVGRLPVLAVLDELDVDSLIKILVEPKNALVKQYKKLLAMDGADLEIRDDALQAVAQKAIERKTGSRAVSYTHLDVYKRQVSITTKRL